MRLDGSTNIFHLAGDAGGLTTGQINRHELDNGEESDAYGRMAHDGCLEAENILVTAPAAP